MAGDDKMSEEQVAELRQAFNEFDVDGILKALYGVSICIESFRGRDHQHNRAGVRNEGNGNEPHGAGAARPHQ